MTIPTSAETPRDSRGAYDVIVIGGGFAGVTAAVDLCASKRVLLLEASDRLGGRARTIPVAGGVKADVGAHYFGAQHRRVNALVRRLGLEPQVIDYVKSYGHDPAAVSDFAAGRTVYRVSDTYFGIQGIDARAPWQQQARFLSALYAMTALCHLVDGRHPERTPFAKALDGVTYEDLVDRLDPPGWFRELMLAGGEGVWSQRSDRMSLLYFLWYLKNNGGFSNIFNDQKDGPQQYGLRCGMQGLLERHAERFTGETRLGAPVRSVRVYEDGVEVATRDGAHYRARDLVVAVTPMAAGRISFEPELPRERRLLHAQKGGYAVKAMVFYDRPWWADSAETRSKMYAWLSAPQAPGIDWVLATSPPEGDYHALSVFVMPDLVDAHAADGADAVKRAVLEALAALARDPRARAATHVEMCDWRGEEFVGCGPNTTLGVGAITGAAAVMNRPDFGRLHFASAEYATEFTGYVEGAMASGEHAARQIIEGPEVEPRGAGVSWGWLALDAAALPAVVAGNAALRAAERVRGWFDRRRASA